MAVPVHTSTCAFKSRKVIRASHTGQATTVEGSREGVGGSKEAVVAGAAVRVVSRAVDAVEAAPAAAML